MWGFWRGDPARSSLFLRRYRLVCAYRSINKAIRCSDAQAHAVHCLAQRVSTEGACAERKRNDQGRKDQRSESLSRTWTCSTLPGAKGVTVDLETAMIRVGMAQVGSRLLQSHDLRTQRAPRVHHSTEGACAERKRNDQGRRDQRSESCCPHTGRQTHTQTHIHTQTDTLSMQHAESCCLFLISADTPLLILSLFLLCWPRTA